MSFSSTQLRNRETLVDLFVELCHYFRENGYSEIAQHYLQLLAKGKIEEMFQLPDESLDVDSFRISYLLSEVLRKTPLLDLGFDRSAEALKSFSDAEINCSLVNDRFRFIGHALDIRVEDSVVRSILYRARDKIHKLCSGYRTGKLLGGASFGPGATYSLPRRFADLYYKLSGSPECTATALPYVRALLDLCPYWTETLSERYATEPGYPLKVVTGSRVSLVPKSYKTDRTICVEPRMNLFFQRSVGSFLRKRLLRVGVDLNDQNINAVLARAGSFDGSLATIDLSSASDSISYGLVKFLFPYQIFSDMDSIRSQFYELDGKLYAFHKFSSMGNGFTFELESLIFWALSAATLDELRLGDRRLGIYGDDIIISKDAFPLLDEILRFCGFTTNLKKTHSSGYFRESCGKHYFHGCDVSPFYWKAPVINDDELIKIVNKWKRFNAPAYCYPTARVFTTLVVQRIRNRFLRKPRIPDGYGDSFIIGSFDEVRPRRHKHHDTWITIQRVPISKKSRPDDYGLLFRRYYYDLFAKLPSELDSSSLLTLNRPITYRVTKLEVFGCWPD